MNGLLVVCGARSAVKYAAVALAVVTVRWCFWHEVCHLTQVIRNWRVTDDALASLSQPITSASNIAVKRDRSSAPGTLIWMISCVQHFRANVENNTYRSMIGLTAFSFRSRLCEQITTRR